MISRIPFYKIPHRPICYSLPSPNLPLHRPHHGAGHWCSEFECHLQASSIHYDDSHSYPSLPLWFAYITFKISLHSLKGHLPQKVYILGTYNRNPGKKPSTVISNLISLQKLQPSKPNHTMLWMSNIGLQHTSLIPHQRSNRFPCSRESISRILSLSCEAGFEPCLELNTSSKNAKIGHCILIECMDRWQSRWSHPEFPSSFILLPLLPQTRPKPPILAPYYKSRHWRCNGFTSR